MRPFTFFVSYRRQDTAPIALLLKHEIEKRLQFVRVSVDVEDILHGDDFPERIKELVDVADATIVLIGRSWLPRIDRSRDATPRDSTAANFDDWIVREVQYSLSTPVLPEDCSERVEVRRTILPIFVDCERNFDQFILPEQLTPLRSIQAERIDYAGWPNEIGPLVERIGVKLGLKKRPDADEYPPPDPAKARTQPVADDDLTTILNYQDYNGWYLDNFGNAEVLYLVKIFKFQSFAKAAAFMAMVSAHCQVLEHHPEWRNVVNHVTVALTTFDARRRVTIYDLHLALFMNKAAAAVEHATGT